MYLKKRLITGSLAGTLLAALLPGVAAAAITEGRPGQFEMSSMLIDAVELDCEAFYDMGVNSNAFVDGTGEIVHVVVNRNGARATCRFTDTSGVFESNAEVGYTSACVLVTAEGTWEGGTGRVTVAANNSSDGLDGGNASITCRFDAASAPTGDPQVAPDDPAGPDAVEPAPFRVPGKPAWARGPKADEQVDRAHQGRAKGQAAKVEKTRKAEKTPKAQKTEKPGRGRPRD